MISYMLLKSFYLVFFFLFLFLSIEPLLSKLSIYFTFYFGFILVLEVFSLFSLSTLFFFLLIFILICFSLSVLFYCSNDFLSYQIFKSCISKGTFFKACCCSYLFNYDIDRPVKDFLVKDLFILEVEFLLSKHEFSLELFSLPENII